MKDRVAPVYSAFCWALFFSTLFTTSLFWAASAAAQDASDEQTQTIAEWKATIIKLRKLEKKHLLAAPADKPAIEREFNEVLAQARELEPAVNAAIEKQFAQSTRGDAELEQILLSRLMAGQQYREVLRLANVLIDGGCKNPQVYELGVTAAIDDGQIDLAKRFIANARKRKIGSEKAETFAKALDEKLKLWTDELAIRTKQQAAGQDDPAKRLPRVKLETSEGDIVIELLEDEAPNTVANFVSLVEKGFYDGLTFHRIIPGFMAQGGDPRGTGTGGPGYNIKCECVLPDYRHHYRGTLSMAHAGQDTGGSQFFITFNATPQLDGKHTAFGYVVEGFDTLERLEKLGSQDGKPTKTPVIKQATVLNKRDHKYQPQKVGS